MRLAFVNTRKTWLSGMSPVAAAVASACSADGLVDVDAVVAVAALFLALLQPAADNAQTIVPIRALCIPRMVAAAA